MIMKKGVAEQVFIIAAFITIIYAFLMTINFSWTSGVSVEKDITVQQNLYTMQNALDGGRLFLDTSLKYSVYQALFDYGGEDKVDANKDSFSASLAEKIKQNLNVYSKQTYTFLSQNYQVKLPQYTGVSVSQDIASKTINIKATPADSMKIEKDSESENIFLAKKADLEFVLPYPLLEKIISLSPSSMKDSMIKSVETEWKKIDTKTVSVCTDKKATDLEVFNEANKKSFKDFVEAQGGFSSYVESKVVDMKSMLKLEGSIEPKTLSAKIGHSCKETIQPCSEANKFTYTKTCSFAYTYSGKVKVDIKDSSSKYPVKIGSGDSAKVSMEKPAFVSTNSIEFTYE